VSNKKVLVAGGAGFIGANLCRKLLKEGCIVTCIDNLSTGREENLKALLSAAKFKFIKHDIIMPFDYDLEVKEIYNLACPASPVQYQKDPIQTLKSNVIGSINLLELAKSKGARILQTSTSEIYGDPECDIQKESYWGNVNPIGIRSCYDEGKRCAETLFFDYHRQYNTDIRVARIFNTYGPFMSLDDGRVVSNFINQALNDKKITVYGDGSQTRSFCFVDDMVEGLIRLMNATIADIKPVNLGNPSPIDMVSLAKNILNIMGKKLDLEYLSLPQDDPKKRNPDISLAKNLLGWMPVVSLEEGLEKTIDYFSNL
jgi:UDP-glucuronate decarboxylase